LRDGAMAYAGVWAARFRLRGTCAGRARFPRLRSFGVGAGVSFFWGSFAPNSSFKPTPPRGGLTQALGRMESHMEDYKVIINSIGIVMTMVGVYMVYANSPINDHVIDGGTFDTDHAAEERSTKRRNKLMTIGVYIVLTGSLLQLVSNFLP
jgi:hypothetical protein